MGGVSPSPSYTPEWWRETTIYHIYPRSFRDASGDGIGDLRGVIERLDYLQYLGVETLWLSPFYQSPQQDLGYDISDHLEIASEYGSASDLKELFDAAHGRGMKIVLDIVLNHTSRLHPWFEASRASRDNPFRDFYLWRDGRKPGGRAPPNNWRSALGAPGWHHDPATDQWYFASFLPFQPDLNYRNPVVRERMLAIVRSWLVAGADGVRLDLFHALHKDVSFSDNPFSFRALPSDEDLRAFFQSPRHTLNHPDTVAFARELRRLLDEFESPPRFAIGEVFGDLATLRGYCGGDSHGLHLVFLFKTLSTPFSARHFRRLIADFERYFPEPLLPTWVLGNHDRPRLLERLGASPEKAKLLAALQLTARGVPVIYYGDELGLPHHDLPMEGALDPVAAHFKFVPGWLHGTLRRRGMLLNRDTARSPMPWDASSYGGFTAAETVHTWLPVHPAYPTVNVAAQQKDAGSVLACYRRLLAWRGATPALHRGRLDLGTLPLHRDLLYYVRQWQQSKVHVVLNFSGRRRPLRLSVRTSRVCSSLRDDEARALPTEVDAYEALLVFEAPSD